MHDINKIKKEIIERDYPHLNNMQKQAVLTVNGPLLVLAGAGSGKTTVLINRISNILNYGNAYQNDNLTFNEYEVDILTSFLENDTPELRFEVEQILNEERVKPYEILAITFTNKAAKELKERLEKALGEQAQMIWARTFHSACSQILRANAEHIGYTNEFTIYDESDKKKLLSDIVKSLNLDDKQFDPKVFSGAISRSKDSLISPSEFAQTCEDDIFQKKTAVVYKKYQEALETNNAMDFDDIICKTVQLFDENPDVLRKYQEKFRYILVDEYQDTNHAQYTLIKILAQNHQNICVVGDDDQGIYKFRGATIKNILEFEKDYTTAQTIRLEQNYRSTSNILNAANGLIEKNQNRKGKTLWTDNPSREKVYIRECQTGQDEAYYIAKTILDNVQKGRKFSEFAILYRNHALSNAIEHALKRMGVPYKMFSGLRFFDRAEVKDMLSYLCVINNAHDTLRLKRIINVPARKIGAKTIEMVDYVAEQQCTTFFNVLQNASSNPDLKRSGSSLIAFADMILDLKNDLATLPLDEFYDNVVKKSGYEEMLTLKGDMESIGKLENVREVKSSIVEYIAKCEGEPTLNGFLEEISLFTDLDNEENATDFVTMMTIHSSKGLEFTNVFITGMEQNIFPSARSMNDPAEVEEERRLAYVAVTRAKEFLSLSYSTQRLLYGQTQYYKPSMFLGEIPEEFTRSNVDVKAQASLSSNASSNPFINNSNLSISTSSKKSDTSDIDLKVGDRIKHKAFGEGLITSAKPMGGDLLIEIAFDTIGTKKLLAKTASAYISKL